MTSAPLIKKQATKFSITGNLTYIFSFIIKKIPRVYTHRHTHTHIPHLVFHHHEEVEEGNVKMQNTSLRIAIKYSPAMYHVTAASGAKKGRRERNEWMKSPTISSAVF